MKLSKISTWKSVALIGVFSLLSLQAFAHEGGRGEKGGGFDPEKRAARMKEELSLSDEQAAKIKDILAAKKQAVQEEYEKNAEKWKQARQQTHDQIAAVLNDEQKAKFEKITQERQEKMKEKFQENRHDRRNWKKDKGLES